MMMAKTMTRTEAENVVAGTYHEACREIQRLQSDLIDLQYALNHAQAAGRTLSLTMDRISDRELSLEGLAAVVERLTGASVDVVEDGAEVGA